MILENARATFRDQGDGWTYWLVDYYDPSGENQTEPQASPTFARDVNGNPFDTDSIYLAASSHPLLGDGLVPFRFDAVTGLPVIIGSSIPSSPNTIGGYDTLFTKPQNGDAVTFFTLPNGKILLINQALLTPTLQQVLAAGDTTSLSLNFNATTQQGIYFRDASGNVAGFIGKRADGTLVLTDTVRSVSLTTETDGTVRVNGVKILLDGQVQTKTPGIDDVLLVDNFSGNSLRVGGLGIADRVFINEPTLLPCYVESIDPVTGVKTLYYEKTSPEAILTRAFSCASPQTLAYWLSKLVGQNSNTGRPLYTHGGAYCVQIPRGTAQVGGDTIVPITALVDGDMLTHGLGADAYLQVIYDSIGRVVSNAFLEPLNPVDLLKSKFRNPGISDPFTGTAKLTPLPTQTT